MGIGLKHNTHNGWVQNLLVFMLVLHAVHKGEEWHQYYLSLEVASSCDLLMCMGECIGDTLSFICTTQQIENGTSNTTCRKKLTDCKFSHKWRLPILFNWIFYKAFVVHDLGHFSPPAEYKVCWCYHNGCIGVETHSCQCFCHLSATGIEGYLP